MLTRADIADAVLDHGAFQHGFTSAGNPLACATGLAVINEICEQDLIANTATVGTALKSALVELMDEFSFIGDVRGKGLLLAMELVQDRDTMQVLPPAMNAANRVVDIAYEQGLIVYARRTRGGNSGDHIMVCPPMITTLQQVDEVLAKLHDSLRQFSTEL
jgi:adenosylmethionine-8-amino-7-oxononanoate aminotransferase